MGRSGESLQICEQSDFAVFACLVCLVKPFLACGRHSLAVGAPGSCTLRLYFGEENSPQAVHTPQGVPLLPSDHKMCTFLLAVVFFPLPCLATLEVISRHTAAYMNF